MNLRIWCLRRKLYVPSNLGILRYLSSTEVSTALRPFYFAVHPDLFGQYPNERKVNENSLKLLSSYIELVQNKKFVKPTTLTFYLRSQSTDPAAQKGKFRTVIINLSHRDLRETVLSILNACDLPTKYIDQIPKKSEPFKTENFHIDVSRFDEHDPVFSSIILKSKIRKAKDAENLRPWLAKNAESACLKQAACQPIRDEIDKLQKVLQNSLGLSDIIWDCGWNVTHFRGCLQSFLALAKNHPELMHVLKGRTLVFGNDTGVNVDGHIMLNSGEVRHNWLDLIRNVHKQDAALLRIPAFENAVAKVLKDIRIVRRKFMPKVMAENYEKQLRRLITSLSDYQGRFGFPKEWPDSFSDFKLVVEAEAGPLMVSPTGQFIVPASCPGFLLVNFITENLSEAQNRLQRYQRDKHVEINVKNQCITLFNLGSLKKDDNITPDLMIECCQHLLDNYEVLTPLLKGVHLWVTSYYSVLSGGEMCIPWNWKI